MVRGLKKVDQKFVLSMPAYNLMRTRSLGQFRPRWQYWRQGSRNDGQITEKVDEGMRNFQILKNCKAHRPRRGKLCRSRRECFSSLLI